MLELLRHAAALAAAWAPAVADHAPAALGAAAVLALWLRAGLLWPKAGAARRSLRQAGLLCLPGAEAARLEAVGFAPRGSALWRRGYEARFHPASEPLPPLPEPRKLGAATLEASPENAQNRTSRAALEPMIGTDLETRMNLTARRSPA